MKLEPLTPVHLTGFADYCRRHRNEVDDSFLYEEDLAAFEPNSDNPTYILTNEQGRITAVASLILNEYYRWGRKGRFRIFHSEKDDLQCYSTLFQGILQHVDGLDQVFLYVPLANASIQRRMSELSFQVERYAFILVRDVNHIPPYHLPNGYEFRPFVVNRDEAAYCHIRNIAFANLAGSETPITPKMVSDMTKAPDYIEGGVLLLYHCEEPIGILRCSSDEWEDQPVMNIGPLALIPEYQGRGLGRILLRKALQFTKDYGYDRAYLSVNGENERAKSLYLSEGFQQVEGVACNVYKLPSK